MSNVIQINGQTARLASLLQQRPGDLIAAVEERATAGTIYEVPQRAAITGTGAMGSAVALGMTGALRGAVVLVDDDYSTSGSNEVHFAPAINQPAGAWISDASRWTRWIQTTKDLLQHVEPHTGGRSAAARIRVDKLNAISAAFGLPMGAVAEMLQITRQGLYKWLDATKDIALHETSRARFAIVDRLARAWRDQSAAPLAAVVHEQLSCGRTAYDLLTAPVIDEPSVRQAFDELRNALKAKPQSLSEKLLNSGFARRVTRRSPPEDE